MRSEHIQESYENDKKMASSKKKTKKKMNNGLHLWTENGLNMKAKIRYPIQRHQRMSK